MTSNVADDLTPIESKSSITGAQFFAYRCVDCGKDATNSYVEPTGSRMLEARVCFFCDYDRQLEAKLKLKHKRMTIIGGRIYGPGNRTSGSFRGMAGRRFDIEFIEPSQFAGKRITTFDLWSGSEMPDRLKSHFPDTAKFLNDATEAKVGDTTCWNPSSSKAEPYPLPRTLNLA